MTSLKDVSILLSIREDVFENPRYRRQDIGISDSHFAPLSWLLLWKIALVKSEKFEKIYDINKAYFYVAEMKRSE